MTTEQPTIVATSIGFNSMKLGEWDWRLGPVYRYVADLAHAGHRAGRAVHPGLG